MLCCYSYFSPLLPNFWRGLKHGRLQARRIKHGEQEKATALMPTWSAVNSLWWMFCWVHTCIYNTTAVDIVPSFQSHTTAIDNVLLSKCRSAQTLILLVMQCGTWWRIGWGGDFQPDGRGFDSRSSRHVGTLGKFFTCSIRAVVGSTSE